MNRTFISFKQIAALLLAGFLFTNPFGRALKGYEPAGWGYQKLPNAPLTNIVEIAAGFKHNIVLKSDGSILGWGLNDYGQASPPEGNNFVSIAAGEYHNVALRSDGIIVCWGDDANDQATPPGGNDYTAIAAGYDHSLAIRTDGSIVCWGDNTYGQSTPPAGNDFVDIAGGFDHSLALKSDGSIVGWGNNSHGQAIAPAGNNFIAVSAGYQHSLALRADGTIVGWGDNYCHQATAPAGNNFIAISAGPCRSIAVKSDGGIIRWGGSLYLESTPAGKFTDVSVGYEHSLALKTDGSVISWGDNHYAQTTAHLQKDYSKISAGDAYGLGIKTGGSIIGWGDNYSNRATSPGGSNFVDIAAGYWHSLAIKSDGSLACWGYNPQYPVTPPAGNFVSISVGNGHSLALRTDGSIAGWGDIVAPPAGYDFTAIAAGSQHGLALKSDGSIVGWGDDSQGQATPPAGNDFVAISAGDWHSLALKSDGSIVGWGRDTNGQASPPFGYDFTAISAGCGYSLALKSDGSIVGWGRNDFGEASPPEGTGFAAISAGNGISVALRPNRQTANPIPSSGATNESVNVDLSWTGVEGANNYDVYFGTNPSPGIAEYRGNQTNLSFDPGTLNAVKTYYWRIDANSTDGITTGDVWSFTSQQLYTISGYVKTKGQTAVANVTVTFSNNGGTTKTDTRGYYALKVPSGWSGRVTPTRTNSTFVPSYKSYTAVKNTISGQNFTWYANPIISGYIKTAGGSAIAGVVVTANNNGGTSTTNTKGYYSLRVPYNWKGTVRASKSYYSWSPGSRTYTTGVTKSKTSQNFTGYAWARISGYVKTSTGTAISGVTISVSNLKGTVTTSSTGYYALRVPYKWSGTIRARKSYYTCLPSGRSYTSVTSSKTGQNFTGYVWRQISGYIKDSSGTAIPGMNVSASNGSKTSSDATGYYALRVPFNWTGSVKPSNINYVFTPLLRNYAALRTSKTSQNYTAD